MSYGRRVTGRLAFQASAGPEIVLLSIPLREGHNKQALVSNDTCLLVRTISTSVPVTSRDLGVTYSHGVNGGAGVLAGSLADTVTGTASRQLSRAASGAVEFRLFA